jgi:hypothetical protein
VLPGHTVPLPSVPAPPSEEPLILGLPAEFETGCPTGSATDVGADLTARDPQAADGPARGLPSVVLRRREWFGGLALVLAGVAADVSLWTTWFRGSGADGLTLVRQGLAVSRSGIGDLARSGLWQPLAVVLGGGLLVLLGLLLFLRGRTHRVVGVLALFVAMVVATGVVVPLADANWSAASFGLGMWLAVAVALLGVVGAVKAMATIPAVEVAP